MPFPAGDDHCRALRPRPAYCSPAMIIAFGSDSSFSMHSWTTRRATRFVDATRGISAMDSRVFSWSTSWRVLRSSMELLGCWVARLRQPSNSVTQQLLILHQLLDPRAQF